MLYHVRNVVVTFPGGNEHIQEFDLDVDREDTAMAIARREADATCTRLGKPATVRTDVRKIGADYSWDFSIATD